MRLAVILLLGALLVPVATAEPEQVHLGLPADDPSTSMSVLWLESQPREQTTVTLTGPDGEARDAEAVLVEGPSAGFAYEARFTDLTPDSPYTYDLGGVTGSFTTAPKALPPQGLSIVALGDMGISSNAAAVRDLVAELAPDLVLHAGDLSYAEGDPTIWKAWFDLVEPVAAGTPWITALGNHETYTGVPVGWSPAEIAFYEQRFGLPGNELWYSFDWGGVHIVALDTYSDPTGIRPEQVQWLEEDLKEHADATWTIVFLHQPPYSSNAHGSSSRVQEAFVPLFDEHGVDLVIGGHDHGYERSYALRDGKVVDGDNETVEGDGTVYLVTGGAGASLYSVWEEPAPSWSATRVSGFHVTALKVTADAIVGRPVMIGEPFADAFAIRKPDATSAEEEAPPPEAAATPLASGVAVMALLLGTFRRRA